jgi:tetratricopeptide (TPR) repeat protein
MGWKEDWLHILLMIEQEKWLLALEALNSYIQANPGEPESHLLRIKVLEKTYPGMSGRMLEDAETALRLQPDDPQLMFEKAQRLQNHCQYFAAMDLYDNLTERYPDQAEYLLGRLKCRVKNFKEPPALILDDIDAAYSLGIEEAWLEELEEEIVGTLEKDLESYWVPLESITSQGANPDEREEDLTLLVKTLWALARFEEVGPYLARLREHNPENGMVLIFEGRAFRDQEKNEEALDRLQRGYCALAKILEKSMYSEVFEFWEYYRTAIAFDKNNIAAIHGLAYSLQHFEDRQCVEYFSRLIDISPENADYYRQRGVEKFIQGDYAKAIQDLTRVLELGEATLEDYEWRMNAYIKTEQFDNALIDVEEVIRLDPEYKQTYRDNPFLIKAGILYKMRAWEAALDACDTSRRVEFKYDDHVERLKILSQIYTDTDQSALAVECLNELARYNPKLQNQRFRSQQFIKLDLLDEALAAAEMAIAASEKESYSPLKTTLFVEQSRILWMMKNHDEAEKKLAWAEYIAESSPDYDRSRMLSIVNKEREFRSKFVEKNGTDFG